MANILSQIIMVQINKSINLQPNSHDICRFENEYTLTIMNTTKCFMVINILI